MSDQAPDAVETGAWAAAAAGCALRFAGLSAPFGPQEIMGLRPSESPLLEIPGRLARLVEAADPPLFHLLLRAWRLSFGASNVSVHFLTAALGVLAVAAAAWAGRRLGGRRVAALAAAAVALHPYAFAYSQEARAYALLLPLEFLSLGALGSALESDSRDDWQLFAAATSAAVWTHDLAIFFALAEAAVVALSGRASARAAAAFAAVAAAFALWLPSEVRQADSAALPRAAAGLWPSIDAVLGSSVAVEAGAGSWPAAGLVSAACAAAGLLLAARAERAERRKLAGLALCGALSLAFPAAASIWKPIFNPWRHAALAVPAACLFWGLALASPRRTAAALSLAAVFAVTDLRLAEKPKTVYPELVHYLSENGSRGPALLVHPAYRREFLDALGLPALPRAELCGKAGLPEKVLVVFFRARGHVEPSEPCDWSVLRARYRRVGETAFGDGAVVTAWTLARR